MKNKAILNSETEFTRLTTKQTKSTANRFIPRAVYQCLSFPISIKFFLQCRAPLVKIFTRSRRDLAAISARIAARSRRDRGAFLAAEISPSRRDHGRDRGEITARYGKSRRPKTRHDLAVILAEMREISAAKNSPRSRRDSRRDAGNLGGQKRAAISPRSQRDMEISAGKYAARCCSEIAARYGNLGGQNAL